MDQQGSCVSFRMWMCRGEEFENDDLALGATRVVEEADNTRSGLSSLLRLLGDDGLLPSHARAAAEWQDLVTWCWSRESGGLVEWSEDWFLGLTRKYRPFYKVVVPCPVGEGTAGELLQLVWDLLPDHVRLEAAGVFSDLGLPGLSNSLLLPRLKALGEFAKHHGSRFSAHWIYYVNWELCFGAPPLGRRERQDFLRDVEDWVVTERPEDRAGCDRDRVLMTGLALLKSLVPPVQSVRRPFSVWSRSPTSWLTSGASDVVGIGGAVANKVSTYLACSHKELEMHALDSSDPIYKATVKRERGKHRNIVNAPWSLFLQQSFVGDGLEDHISRYIPTSLKKGFGVHDWDRWIAAQPSTVGVPIDQSGFDHVPSGRVVFAFLDWLCDVGAANDRERTEVAAVLKKRLRRGAVGYEGTWFSHRRGVLSGWKFTAILDTVINYAESLAIHASLGLDTPSDAHHCYQGDDCLLLEPGWGVAHAVAKRYTQVLPVNSKKFFLDDGRTEYLRYVLSAGRRRGYPVRAVASTFVSQAWQSGGSFSPAALASTWSILASRGMDSAKCLWHCCRDVAAFTRERISTVRDWMATPASLGGFGCVELGCASWVKMEADVVETTPVGEWRDHELTRRAAEWAKLPFASRVQLTSRMREVGLPRTAAQGLATYLTADTRGVKWRAQRVDNSVFASGCPSSGLGQRGGERSWRGGVNYKLPPASCDSFYSTVALAADDGDEVVKQVFGLSGSDYIREVRSRMPRRVFREWLTGAPGKVKCNYWGAASDARAHGIFWATSFGVYPRGPFTMGAYVRRCYDLECVARTYARDFAHLGA
nr:RNA-dependent RNA polymerase [Drosophila-associated totivirus 5]